MPQRSCGEALPPAYWRQSPPPLPARQLVQPVRLGRQCHKRDRRQCPRRRLRPCGPSPDASTDRAARRTDGSARRSAERCGRTSPAQQQLSQPRKVTPSIAGSGEEIADHSIIARFRRRFFFLAGILYLISTVSLRLAFCFLIFCLPETLVLLLPLALCFRSVSSTKGEPP